MVYKFFEPTQDVDSYIDNKDTDALRGILAGIINRDPTFVTARYDETLDYISKRFNIWDAEWVKLPGEYELPEAKWDKEYFYKQLAWLSQNFNRERIEYIKNIGKKVYANEHTWGKEEAENFLSPGLVEKKSAEKSQGAAGRLTAALLTAVIIVAVIFFIPQLPSVPKIVLIIAIVIILAVCAMKIWKRGGKM